MFAGCALEILIETFEPETRGSDYFYGKGMNYVRNDTGFGWVEINEFEPSMEWDQCAGTIFNGEFVVLCRGDYCPDPEPTEGSDASPRLASTPKRNQASDVRPVYSRGFGGGSNYELPHPFRVRAPDPILELARKGPNCTQLPSWLRQTGRFPASDGWKQLSGDYLVPLRDDESNVLVLDRTSLGQLLGRSILAIRGDGSGASQYCSDAAFGGGSSTAIELGRGIPPMKIKSTSVSARHGFAISDKACGPKDVVTRIELVPATPGGVLSITCWLQFHDSGDGGEPQSAVTCARKGGSLSLHPDALKYLESKFKAQEFAIPYCQVPSLDTRPEVYGPRRPR